MIPIIKPFLPPQKEYNSLISKIWENNWLTNDGPLVKKLEFNLKSYLGTNNFLFVNNGTNALMLAIRALELKGEIITTPFSFVATTSSIVWEHCTPIFVDIEQKTLNIDANKIEAAISDKTSAILATHVYGNPCEVEKIEAIAKKHNLKVIYDGAHAFGIRLNGKSIFEYGDISICSTHATKVFHTTEGGFLVTQSEEVFKKLESMRNFGFKDSTSFSCLGINAKNSEFHAAMGLINLKFQSQIFEKRKALTNLYDSNLFTEKLPLESILDKEHRNYSYYAILFESEEMLLECEKALKQQQIFTRRYFYPSLANSLPYVDTTNELPIVEDISKCVLCLPLYFDLKFSEVNLICSIIKDVLVNKYQKPSICL
ncbi:DegT/DnrJ/EryC1/StrS family aminotransferase [Polaribacter sp. WD7]|uniref:DegT/DnrJ/EryC1/StrS family aminotransferase n=1 Tax=Polaribacter sp. WD7 TaxID=2269061 RepID=UPI000DF2BE7E|nr:DegT/DnrJ/EryC1/StrS family aminotransferase [Polaribacter sp. WD7]RCS26021.1 DegT/DnrJ/EryC1/StrS family aminotransferase [Polaribacter sp. WD7]